MKIHLSLFNSRHGSAFNLIKLLLVCVYLLATKSYVRDKSQVVRKNETIVLPQDSTNFSKASVLWCRKFLISISICCHLAWRETPSLSDKFKACMFPHFEWATWILLIFHPNKHLKLAGRPSSPKQVLCRAENLNQFQSHEKFQTPEWCQIGSVFHQKTHSAQASIQTPLFMGINLDILAVLCGCERRLFLPKSNTRGETVKYS